MNRSQLSQLAVLAAVAAHGSFRGAARELAIAPSAVSHAVATLEDSLGVRLLARTTRSVAPTEAGRRLLERLAPALAEIDQALGAALETKDRPAGILRISSPLVATQLILAPRLGEFARLYPDITLDLRIDNAFTDIVAAGFDAGVRLGENLEADMIAVRLGVAPWWDRPPISKPVRPLRIRAIWRGTAVCVSAFREGGSIAGSSRRTVRSWKSASKGR